MICLDNLFDTLEDPRGSNVSHRLSALMVIMIAASLCGQVTATDIALFADLRKDVLNRIVSYDRAPSHDTISRLLRLIDRDAFAKLFVRFAAGFAQAVTASGGPDVVALDGKALRRAYASGRSHAPPIMVSAFATSLRLTLAAEAPADGKGEVDAAKRVIELIDLTGKIVTADALHCTHDMAHALREAGADYALGLKKNRPQWHAEAEALFARATPKVVEVKELNHGRAEWRQAAVIPAPTARADGHAAFGRVVSCRDASEPDTRYFLLSKQFEPRELLHIIRSHWQIENVLHWTLDVHLGEDHIRARKDNAPANIALLKRIARNMLQIIDQPKVPISHRIKKCIWNQDYLISAFTHMR